MSMLLCKKGDTQLTCSFTNCNAVATHSHIIEFEENQMILSEVCTIHAILIKNSQVQHNSVMDIDENE